MLNNQMVAPIFKNDSSIFKYILAINGGVPCLGGNPDPYKNDQKCLFFPLLRSSPIAGMMSLSHAPVEGLEPSNLSQMFITLHQKKKKKKHLNLWTRCL